MVGWRVLAVAGISLVTFGMGASGAAGASQRGSVSRVSVSSIGEQGDYWSGPLAGSGVAISAHGRYVAFLSEATNLVPGDTNLAGDAFVRDRLTSMTDAKGKKIDIGLAPTPIGPSGHRASMFNGLADSITTLSKNPEADAKWVKFLSGEQCQDIIAQAGAVFPARPHATDLAIQYNKDVRHLDVTPFTDQVKNKTTFLFPVTSNAADITALMQPAMDSVYIGEQPVGALTGLNSQLNELFTYLG